MTLEIIKDHNMALDIDTEWIPVQLDKISNFGKKAMAVSLQISWQDVTGTLDGEIEVYISNDQDGKSLGNTYPVDTATNTEDCEFIVLSHIHFNYIKLNYSKNSISGGRLNANLSYSSQ